MPPEKSRFIQNVFAEVPPTYEMVNHVLTLALDILWRRRAAKIAAATANPGNWADMCTGTGEMAVYLTRLAPKETKIYAIDFSPQMMARAAEKPEAENINFVTADITALPFPDETFDLITISFATRNINLCKEILIQTFAEFHRVLKPGALFVNLETSQPPSYLIRKLFHLYIKLFVKLIGARISGSRTAYAYLAKTIPRFYAAEELAEIIAAAGFQKVSFKRLMFGAAAIHHATRL